MVYNEHRQHELSIIIPHYNSPKLLEKLLLSIPEKEDIQTIVVDDNSSKDVADYKNVAETYSYRAEFYINDSGVQSAGACRNIGLDHADGEWVMFADADDYFLPRMYESVSKYFDSDAEMVIFCPTSVFIDTGEIADRHIVDEERINKYLANPTHENLLEVKRKKSPWSMLVRRRVITDNNLRFSETLHHNDMYFVFMVEYYCTKTLISGDKIYCITRNSGSLTTKVTEKAYDFHVQELIKCYHFGEEHYSPEDFAVFNLNGGFVLFKAYKRKLGLKKIVKTYRLLKENGVPLFSKQMRNPVYLLKAIFMNNRVVNREKKYYVKK